MTHSSSPSRFWLALLPLLLTAVLLAALFLASAPGQIWRARSAPASTSSSLPTTSSITAEITLEEPTLVPTYTTCDKTYWYPVPSGRGHNAYLTLNTLNPQYSTNSATWRPDLPQRGYYRIEAYIPAHGPITWCSGSHSTIYTDTAQAHYAIQHAWGGSEVVRSQELPPTATRWIDLGEFIMPAGTQGSVTLVDLNGESDFSRTVSFSAMRFTYLRPAPEPIFMPIIARPPIRLPPVVEIQQGPAFDTCVLPSLVNMQNWWTNSPYHAYGLYLGGISYATGCTKANAAWASTARQQGWTFIPIWVGPQAPCWGYKHPMDGDPLLAYQQGRSEADLASAAAASLGLTGNGLSGTIIYYNLEAYGSTPSSDCQAAVNAFMNGWVERLHELGNVAGVYAAACSSHPTDLANIPHVPDYLWVAAYYLPQYDPSASVFGMPCLSNGLWANHQRIRQYAGGHSENWNGESLFIDSNVMDGAVLAPHAGAALAAQPSPRLEASTSSTASASIQDAGWLAPADLQPGGPASGWLVQANRLFWTDNSGLTWQDRTPGEAALSLATFLDSQTGWALSAPFGEESPTLYQTTDGGVSWSASRLPLPEGLWLPVQLSRTDARHGWMVLRQGTSSAFDIAMLLQTSDGGRSWQSYDLPASGTITFLPNNSTEGWLSASLTPAWYHTQDGGQTWQPIPAKALPQPLLASSALPGLPGAPILSGSQDSRLSWAVTRSGQCTGEKLSPDYACTQQDQLWLSWDGGSTWQAVSLP